MPEVSEVGKQTTAKLQKLIALQKDLLEKFSAVNLEIDELLGGGAGFGNQVKTLESVFDRAWGQRYAGGMTGRYIWRHTIDKPNLKRLLKQLGLEELERRMWTYIRNDDPFYVRTRHNFGTFVASINSHAGDAPAPADLELSARPVGCEHNPPCASDQVHTRTRMREMRS